MKKRDIFDAMGHIDEELLESSEKEEKKGKVWLKWSAVAACLCITGVLAWGIEKPYAKIAPVETPQITVETMPNDTPSENETQKLPESQVPIETKAPESVGETQKTPESQAPIETKAPESEIDKNALPSVSVVPSNGSFAGKTELSIGNVPSEGGAAEMAMPGFYIATVAELEVVEMLPDKYSLPGTKMTCHIVKMRVKDAVVGEGLPETVYLKYYYYGKAIFDGYDSFIISLSQCGTDGYMMVNESSSTVEYFPNMFEVYYTNDLGYGSAIAFKDGTVAEEFSLQLDRYWVASTKEYLFGAGYENGEYPAGYESEVDEVKNNIVKMWNNENYYGKKHGNVDYISSETVFAADEAKALLEYVTKDGATFFRQSFSCYTDTVTIWFSRVINGFTTDETILLRVELGGNTEIEVRGDKFDSDELAAVPDLGGVISELENNLPEPPHIDTSGMIFNNAYVKAKFKKVGGEIFGVVCICWTFKDSDGYMDDDMYYLYDSSGNGRIVERDELRAVIGDDNIINNFEYGMYYEIAWK